MPTVATTSTASAPHFFSALKVARPAQDRRGFLLREFVGHRDKPGIAGHHHLGIAAVTGEDDPRYRRIGGFDRPAFDLLVSDQSNPRWIE